MKEISNVEKISTSLFPTKYGTFNLYAFKNRDDGTEHLTLTTETIRQAPLVRIQSTCLTGEAFASLRCDCGFQLQKAMELIAQSQNGILIHLYNQEGRGIGLANKVSAYALQDQGFDTVDANHLLGFEADLRDYATAVAILNNLEVTNIRLLTNNLEKLRTFEKSHIKVIERVSLLSQINSHNFNYLKTKKEKLGHLINLTEGEGSWN